MSMHQMKTVWIMALMAALLVPAAALADVWVFCLDTSGSMDKYGKFEAAKAVLAQQIHEARPGDMVYVIAFDSNDYPIGRVEVGEDGSPEAKEQLIGKIRGLKARGKYTNLDEPLQAAKAFLLEERSPGTRKIILLSDGLSDPSPDHVKLDLQGIAEMIPQTLGWGVYIVGLPDDIAGLFQAQPQDTGIISAPENEHIKGIALERFVRANLEAALAVAKHDVTVAAPPPVPVVPTVILQELREPQEVSPPPDVDGSSTPVTEEPLKEPQKVQEASRLPPPPPTGLPLPWLISAVALAAMGTAPLWRRRRGRRKRHLFTLEVQEGEAAAKQVALTLEERTKKTVGSRGDVPLEDPGLPSMVFTLHWRRSQLWLTPLDQLTVNGRPVTTKTPIAVGDRIGVRGRVKITITEERSDT